MEAPISPEPQRKPNLLQKFIKSVVSSQKQKIIQKPSETIPALPEKPLQKQGVPGEKEPVTPIPPVETTSGGEPNIDRRIPAYKLKGGSADEVLPYELTRYLGTKDLIRTNISGKVGEYGGFVDYAISDKYLFVYLISTEPGRKPFGASFDALTEIFKKAGNRRILTSPLTAEGKKMLEGLEKRGYIVTKSAPKDFTSLSSLEVPRGDFPPVEIGLKYKVSEAKPAKTAPKAEQPTPSITPEIKE